MDELNVLKLKVKSLEMELDRMVKENRELKSEITDLKLTASGLARSRSIAGPATPDYAIRCTSDAPPAGVL